LRIEPVEIYSDATNAAVLRHPGRRFPGVLVQGDTLHEMLRKATRLVAIASGALPEDEKFELAELHEHLAELVAHYKRTLAEHNLPLPFVE
jgi:predicted RNase H-like HicB family nuclease